MKKNVICLVAIWYLGLFFKAELMHLGNVVVTVRFGAQQWHGAYVSYKGSRNIEGLQKTTASFGISKGNSTISSYLYWKTHFSFGYLHFQSRR